MLLAKYILSGAFILIAIAGGVFYSQTEESALGAPTVAYTYDLLPVTDSLYKLGTSTRRFLSLHTDFASTTNLAIDGLLSKGCIGTDGSGNVIEGTCTGGSGGSGTVSTSTNEVAGRVAYFTSNSGTPALLGQVATGTLTGGDGITVSATGYTLLNAVDIDCDVASGSIAGCLSTTDWTTFNSKLSAYNAWTNSTGPTSATSSNLIFGNSSSTVVGSLNVTGNATATNATTTKLNVSNHLTITGTTGTSTITNALQIGGTAGDNRLRITASRSHDSSDSVGGMVRLTNTLNAGSAFGIYTNHAGSATNDLMIIQSDNALYDRRAFRIKQDGTGGAGLFDCTTVAGLNECLNITSTDVDTTALGVSSATDDHGALKVTLVDADGIDGNGSNSAASLISGVLADGAQGMFLTANSGVGSSTGKFLQFRNFDNQFVFDMHHDGRIGVWESGGTADAMLDLTATSTYDYLHFSAGSILTVKTDGKVGIGDATPLSLFTVGTSDAFQVSATGNATATNATTTAFFATTASTSNLYLALGACDTLDTDASGKVICGTDAQGGASEHNEWVNSAGPTSATSSNLIFGNSSSTVVGNLHITGNSTTTHATTTTIAVTTHATTSSLTVSGNLTASQLTSAIILTGATGLAAEYAGTSCTNQFVRSLDAVGAATCATVGTADVAGLDVSDDLNLAATWPVILTGDTLSLGFSTSTALANTQILYATAVNTFGSEAAFTYDPTLNRLTASQASFTTSTTTSATTTNFYSGVASSTSLWATNSWFASSTIGQSTTTKATSTYSFSDNASSTNLWSSAVTFGQGIFTLANQTISTVASAIWNLGDAASLEIPNGTSKTLSAEGQYYHDTTSDNLIMSTSTANTGVVIGGGTTTLYALVVASSSPDMASGGIIELPAHFLGQVATAVICDVDAGTSVVINLSDGTNDTNTVTCTTTETQFAFTSNNEWTAMENIRIEFGTVTGSVDYIKLRFIGYRKTD